MVKQEIAVEELRFGMYVVELDRPWTETPFVFQGFVLKTEQELEILRRHCKRVYVDPERAEQGAAKPASAKPANAPVTEAVRGSTVYRELESVESELPRARSVYTESEALLQDVIQAAQSGAVIEGRRVREAVSRVTESIVRNPDAMMLLAKLREKGAHTLRRSLDVSIYMIVFGRFLQLPRESLELLGLLGLLQDIGKSRLPEGLLNKRERLTPEEFELAKSHVEHSVEILRATPALPEQLPQLAALHHERHDGSGYPRGLKGSEIGLYGSIAAIVDCFDALTLTRPYAEQFAPSNALKALYEDRGTLFHAALVEQFIQCIGIFPVGSVVELNSGEIGIVISQNLVRRLLPRVMVVRDANGEPVRPHKLLDLMNEPKVGPGEPYRIRRTLESDKVGIDAREFFL